MKRIFALAVALFLLAAGCATAPPAGSPTPEITEPTSNPGEVENERITIEFTFGTRTGTYSGTLDENGLPDGHGIFTSVNTNGEGWVYDGDWKAGHWNGMGTTTWYDGQTYTGEFKNDAECGHGVLTYSDGAYFEGEFQDGQNAEGTFCSAAGYEYAASLEDGQVIKTIEVYGSDLFEDVYVPYAQRGKDSDFQSVKRDVENLAEGGTYTAEIVDPSEDDLCDIKLYDESGDYIYFGFSFYGDSNLRILCVVSYYRSESNIEAAWENFSTYGEPEYDTYTTHVIGETDKTVADIDDQREFLFNSN